MKLVDILKKGGLVVVPSDTVYGLVVDATNEKAVQKLIQFKNRPPGKPISIFVEDFPMLKRYVEVNEKQMKILKELLPGPFTVILKSTHKTCGALESEKKTLGIRIPDNQFVINLVKNFGKPLTATSANLAGRPSHYSIESLLNELPDSKKKLIDLIIDVGQLPRNKPSTVIDLTAPQLKIIRQGDLVITRKKTYISRSPTQTKKIARYLLKKELVDAKKPLVFIIEGELGVGKTIFVKGIGEILGITDIISPTFVIYYEYSINKNNLKNFYHFDLYEVEEKEEFKYLKIEKLLKPGNILCFEWGEKTGEVFTLLKQKGRVIYVRMKYISKNQREIFVNF